MSKKRKETDERDEVDEETGELKRPEGKEVDVPEPPNNVKAVQKFILTRGGMLSAHDEESVGAMLTYVGLDPEAVADTPPEAGPQEELAPSAETVPAEKVPAVGDGEVPEPEPKVPSGSRWRTESNQ